MASERLLLVDDDVELCEELADVLRDEGYLVQSTSDSTRGSVLASEGRFDLAILDFKMPGPNGLDLLRIIKARSPETRVFLISGRPFIETYLGEQKADHLVAGVISKPFDERILLEAIRRRP